MIINYFKIALRSLYRFKGFAVINLLGLSLGLTAGMLILLYVMDEWSFDRFHTKRDRIFRVQSEIFNTKSSGSSGSMETNAWPVGNILRKEFPEVEAVLYTRSASNLLINRDGKRFRQKNFYASPELLDIFTFPLREGNPQNALTEPYTVVISEEMERKFFNGENALNKTLVLGDTIACVVTGVMKDIPSNSHIQADLFISFATFMALNPSFSYEAGWGNFNMRNYVLLKEHTNAKVFAAKAANLYLERAGEMLKEWGSVAHVRFLPLKEIYLRNTGGNGMGPVGSIDRVYLVGGIALFVILLACINFVNLATARSVYRAKEVGLRKVAGSTRTALIRQFLSESFVITLISLVIAFAFTGLFLPFFNGLLAKNYQLFSFASLPTIGGILTLVVLVTFLSGYYPAVVMSGMKPADVLKGKIKHSEKGIFLRRALVVFQFVISVSLVAGTLVVLDQLEFMQKKSLGFAKDEIFVINAARVNPGNPLAFESFKNELQSQSMIQKVTYANAVPGNQGWVGQVAYPEGNQGDEAASVEYVAVDDDYVPALGLQIIAGRNFDPQRKSDLEEGLLVNETAVAVLGWTSPEDAVGKKITSPSGYPAGTVIGVVKDYHQLGLQQNIGPIVMDFNPKSSYLYVIRYKASDTKALIESLTGLWRKDFPGYDFNYFFLDQDFEHQYQSEKRLGNVFALFSGVTIVIAVIGLFGLVSFMVVARTKEIGIRKTLGASVPSIARLLSKEFIILVFVANVIAFPMIWYLSTQWLQHFAYRMNLSFSIFLFTGAVALLITLAAVSIQTIKAALADPVNSLRYE